MLSSNYILSKIRNMPARVIQGMRVGSDHVFIRCQWHTDSQGQIEKTGSFLVNLRNKGKYKAGSGHCFGCSKHVNDFYTILDPSKDKETAKFEETGDFYAEQIFDDSMDRILKEPEYNKLYPSAIPWLGVENWRGINGKLMVRIGASIIYNDETQTTMAYLPCVMQGKEIGGIRANIIKRGKRNYFNTKGPWIKNKALFPFDYTMRLIKRRGLKTIVLVEGPRDALRCLQFGIPAVAILGSANWSDAKADIILTCGVERVITANDPDKAGRSLTTKIYASLKEELKVLNFDFSKYGDETTDPGNASKEIMRKLKSYVY